MRILLFFIYRLPAPRSVVRIVFGKRGRAKIKSGLADAVRAGRRNKYLKKKTYPYIYIYMYVYRRTITTLYNIVKHATRPTLRNVRTPPRVHNKNVYNNARANTVTCGILFIG